ncbi:MAG TPA: MazG nucleotide pyrophosphohydrolase domain-containing protein, partial [Abditibacteriaceae bacterium]|nr:MazG nucleotide pyrophosphohydrolase domain-containing protein [Abditibacteriaceae bacterium]
MDKLHEEIAELETALQERSGATGEDARQRVAEELGDVLFTAVNLARWQGINPDLALRDTVSRFRARFQTMEHRAREAGSTLEALTPAQWNEMCEAAKSAQPYTDSTQAGDAQ